MFIHLPFLFYRLFRKAKKQTQFSNHFWNNFFTEEEKKTISKRNWKRIHNYPFQIIVFFADLYADLTGKPINEHQRLILTLFSGGLCLYDDFFDSQLLAAQDLKDVYFGKNIDSQLPEVQIFQKIQKEFKKNYTFSTAFTEEFLSFYDAQLKSQAQLKNILSFSDLKQISFNKGGLALVLAWLLLFDKTSEQERKCVYELGAWYQILDDTLDMADDKTNQIQTLATDVQNIKDLENLLYEQTKIMRNLFKKLSYPSKNIKKILRYLQIIGTSGKVHLYKLKKIQKKDTLKHTLQQFSIEDLKWQQNDKKNFWIACKFWWKEE